MSSSSGSDLPAGDAPTSIFATIPHFPKHCGDSPEELKTTEFLSAASGLVTLIGKFGKVFAPVVHDMNGNIKKITQKFQQDQANYEFLEEMIIKLKNSNDLVAVDGLQWLRRGLNFFCRLFTLIIEEYESETRSRMFQSDITSLVQSAYSQTLEPHHGWLGSQLFHILVRFFPSRRQFFYSLAFDQYDCEKYVLTDLQIYVPPLEACVRRLEYFYQEHNLETNYRV